MRTEDAEKHAVSEVEGRTKDSHKAESECLAEVKAGQTPGLKGSEAMQAVAEPRAALNGDIGQVKLSSLWVLHTCHVLKIILNPRYAAW